MQDVIVVTLATGLGGRIMVNSALFCGQDDFALAGFECTGRILGRTLADAVAYLSAETIVIVGSPARAGSPLLFRSRPRHFEADLLEILIESCISNGKVLKGPIYNSLTFRG